MFTSKSKKQVMCRLDEEAYSRYLSLLHESGLSSQEFIKRAITTKRFTVTKKVSANEPDEQLAQLIFQLSKIGNNLNQTAKKLNERSGYVDYADHAGTLKQLRELIELIKNRIGE